MCVFVCGDQERRNCVSQLFLGSLLATHRSHHRQPRLTVCVTYGFHNMSKYREHMGRSSTTLGRKDEANYFFSKLRVHIKDNNNSPHGKFHRFLLQFSSKFPDLNFAPYVLLLLVSSTEKKFTEHTSTGVSRDNDSSVSGRSNT